MKEELKVGIVGANRGSSFMLPFTETSETKATAICDINEDPLQEIGGKFSINQRFTQYEEDYEDSDSEIVDLSNQALTDTRAKDNPGMGYVDWWGSSNSPPAIFSSLCPILNLTSIFLSGSAIIRSISACKATLRDSLSCCNFRLSNFLKAVNFTGFESNESSVSND